MGKSRNDRGDRGGRNHSDHGGHNRRHFELDTDMFNGSRPRDSQYDQNQDRYSSFPTYYDNNNRNGPGRASRANSYAPQQSIFSTFSHTQGPPPAKANPFLTPHPSRNPFATGPRRNTHRNASIATCVSALSAVSTYTGAAKGIGYCYRCASTNRKLREAMYDLLEATLKNGKKLIDEWAWEAGVSPDHMDCERTKMRGIHPPQNDGCDPCYRCKAQVAPAPYDQGRQMSSVPTPAPLTNPFSEQLQSTPVPKVNTFNQHPDSYYQGHQLSSAAAPVPLTNPFGTQLPPQLQSVPQPKVNPFDQTAPNDFSRQSSLAAWPQLPRLMSWTVPNSMPSIPEQEATHLGGFENPGQVAQTQAAQHFPYQQQQQELKTAFPWQRPGHLADAQAFHSAAHQQQQPPIHATAAEVLRNANIPSHTPYHNPFVAIPHHPLETPTPLVQQHPFYPQQPVAQQEQALNSLTPQLGPSPASASAPVPAHEPRIAGSDMFALPAPQHNEMTIPGMLNGADETPLSAVRDTASVSATGGLVAPVLNVEQTEVSRGEGVDAGVGRGREASLSLESELELEEHQQEQGERYCCEVIPAYAI